MNKMIEYLFACFPLLVYFFFCAYKYSIRDHEYFKRLGVPYVKPLPFFGSILDFLTKPGHVEETFRYREIGLIYGYFEGNNPNLSVADPELVNQILTTNFHIFNGRRELNTGDNVVDNMMAVIRGEPWTRIRKIVTKSFSIGRIKNTMNIFKNCAGTMVENFRGFAEQDQCVDTKNIFGAFTMDVIARSAFSTEIDSYNDPNNTFVRYAKRVLNMKMLFKFICFHTMPTKLRKLLNITVTDTKATYGLKNLSLEIMQHRRNSEMVVKDFLQILMNAAKEYEESEAKGTPIKGMSMDELASQSVAFFLAGYDTTASTLSFCAYLLARNLHIQEKLRNEIDEVLHRNNGNLTYEAIHSMAFMQRVIMETLRLFPPIYRLERQANASCELGNTGIPIRKGMLITIPIYAMNRDSNYWENPESFDPDRFENSQQTYIHYLPFGNGPKSCVGKMFALMELKVCLSYLLANFEVNVCKETQVPIKFDKGLNNLLQPLDITLKMKIRENPPVIN